MRFRNFTTIKLSGLEFFILPKVVDKQLAIDFWCVHVRTPFPEKVCLFRRAERQHIEVFAYQIGFVLLTDLTLDLHELLSPALYLTSWDLIFQVIGFRAFFIGVAENSQPVKLGSFHKLA